VPATCTAKSTTVVVPPHAAARVPAVGGFGAAERQLEVRVRVDAAGDDVLAGRVDHRVGGCAQVGAEQHRSGGEQRDDLLAVDEHIGLSAAGGGDDGPALDQRRCHLHSPEIE
jgi:hypothetical protein